MKKLNLQKVLIPFIAILIIAVIALKKPEGFQSDEKFAAVGLHFTGPLSAFPNSSATNSGLVKICSNPVSIIAPLISKYPDLKYSIIQVPTKNIIYDPITEYNTKGTMSPFPTTTNSDQYIIYCNIGNLPNLSPQEYQSMLQLNKPNGGLITNCSTQSQRTRSEDLILKFKTLTNNGQNMSFTPEIKELINTIDTFGDALMTFFGVIPEITYKSTIYEPCIVSGFQNMEGFTVDTAKLYDYKGNPIFSEAKADNGFQCCTIA